MSDEDLKSLTKRQMIFVASRDRLRTIPYSAGIAGSPPWCLGFLSLLSGYLLNWRPEREIEQLLRRFTEHNRQIEDETLAEYDEPYNIITWRQFDRVIKSSKFFPLSNYVQWSLSLLDPYHYLKYRLNDKDSGDYRMSAILSDIDHVRRSDPEVSNPFTPLWPDGVPEEIGREIEAMERAFSSRPVNDFWLRWHRSLLAGAPANVDLLLDIARIDAKDWMSGSRRVAERIAEIEARHVAEAIGLAERVEQNPVTGLLRVVPVPAADPPVILALLAHLEDVLDICLGRGSNGLREDDVVPALLRRALARGADDPQRIEMTMVGAARSLRRDFEAEALPRSAENEALLAAVEETGLAVRALHPEVAEARARIARQAIRELTERDRAQVREAAPLLPDIFDEAVRDDFKDDIPPLVATRDGPPPTEPALRLFSRAAAAFRAIKAFDKDQIGKLEQSSGYRVASILATIGGLVGLALSLLGFL